MSASPPQLQAPKRPVLDWSGFSGPRHAGLPSITDLPYRQATTSGRAAIYHAIKLAAPSPGSAVLVPTYHCPTMIAPVVLLGLEPIFYPIDSTGLPALHLISDVDAQRATCLLAPHYFGVAQSFATLRKWCDETDTLLIEDCAHAFYGMAGERPVGSWGDYATSSLTKFFPIMEGGLLASAHRPLPSLSLTAQGLKAELKACFDIVHLATAYGRMRGFGFLINALHDGRQKKHPPPGDRLTISAHVESDSILTAMRNCDMTRVACSPLRISNWLSAHMPRQQACRRRQQIFQTYMQAFTNQPGIRPLYSNTPANAVPYAFPLWVDDSDRIYHHLRLTGAPIFRWDQRWPSTPDLPDDLGPAWSRHVLQLLCHQNINDTEISRTVSTVLSLIENSNES